MARPPRDRERHPRRLSLIAGVLLAAGVASVFAWRYLRPAPVGPLRDPGANVLLITIDTLRTDAVGAYGNAAANTPWMDRLAAMGVRFTQAHAHNVVTLPSHANILSGRYPLAHGVRDNSGFRFPADRDTLAALLKPRGYRTAAFISAFPVASEFGLNRGFDVYDDDFLDAAPGQPFLIQERSGVETVARAKKWIDSAGGPWFAWVHLYEPHYPYSPPEPFASRFQGSEYAGEVSAVDAALAPLLEPVFARSDRRTLVVLTSDHGESLGQHGESTHGIFAYEPVLHVPLVLFHQHLAEGRVVSEPARHVDLLPTILDALGLELPLDLDGESLLPVINGQPRSGITTYFEALSGSLNRGWAPLHGVVRDRVKYVELPIPELYDLDADPGETENRATSEPQRAEEMRGLLASLLAKAAPAARSTESPENRERLRSLGYVAGSARPPERYTEADDPKRLIDLDKALQDIVGLYAKGDLDGAAARCRDLVRERPTMAMSLVYLAQVERERGDLAAAIGALRKAYALDPRDSMTVSLLGAYLTAAGRPEEALRVMDALPPNAGADEQLMLARAIALARLRRFTEAIEILEAAQRREPSNAKLLIESGTVHLMAGDRPQARAAFERAIALNPAAARAHSSLGAMAAEDGHTDEAFTHWQRAASLDPREYGTLFALGVSFARAGRSDTARAYLEFFANSAPPAQFGPDIARARQWLAAQQK